MKPDVSAIRLIRVNSCHWWNGALRKINVSIFVDGGVLSPAYNKGRRRLGCWFCHNQRISELRRLRIEYPKLWAKMLVLDKASLVTFKPGKTLTDFDRRFAEEERQLSFDFGIGVKQK